MTMEFNAKVNPSYVRTDEMGDNEDVQQTSFEKNEPTDNGDIKSNNDDLLNFEYNIMTDWQAITDADKNLGYYLYWPLYQLTNAWHNNSYVAKCIFQALFFIGYWIFTGISLHRNFSDGVILLVIGIVVILFLAWDLFMTTENSFNCKMFKICYRNVFQKHRSYWNILLGILFLCFFIGYTFYNAFGKGKAQKENLIGISGLLFYIIVSLLVSVAPHRVNWRPVIWGFALQFVFAVFVLHTHPGYVVFDYIGTKIAEFIAFAANGTEFVFGTEIIGNFGFGVLPIIIYFSMMTSMLYYVGFLPYIIRKISWLFTVTCGTTGPESMATAGNMFLGMTESPLLIRPHLAHLTNSEIVAIMTAGFASIAGSVMGAYISFGVNPTHLLTATVMSAPAALAIAKLIHPELQKSKYAKGAVAETAPMAAANIIEAAALGITDSIPLVANIAAILIGFVALQYFLDAMLGWLGHCVGHGDWSFDLLLSYIFYPFVLVMGVDIDEVLLASKLVGQKTFFNEFIAFISLRDQIKLREDGGCRCDVNDNIQWLGERSESLVTYALCGFSNFASIGIMIGAMTALAPTRAKVFSALAVRALIGGTIACLCTGCVVSILYIDREKPFMWGDVDLNNCEFVGPNSCLISCNGTVIDC